MSFIIVLADLPLASAEAIHVIAYDVDPLIGADGNLNDWQDVPNALVLDRPDQVTYGRQQWSGPADLSATVRLAWRNDGIAWASEVTDDVIAQPYTDQAIFEGDHLNLLLDFAPDEEPDRNHLGPNQYHIAISPGNLATEDSNQPLVKPQLVFFAPEGLTDDGRCSLAVRRTDRGYVAEAFIPFDVLNRSGIRQGDDVNFTIAVSDADKREAKQESWMTASTIPWHYGRKMLSPMVFGDGNGRGELRPRAVKLLDGFSLEPGESRTVEFDLPAVPSGKEPHLFFRARVDCDDVRGFVSNALSVEADGKPLTGALLSNRPPEGTMIRGDRDIYVTQDGRIVLWYSPDFEAVEKNPYYQLIDGIKACEYEFRLADAKPGGNKLVFTNRAEKMPDIARKAVIADVELRIKTPRAEEQFAPAPTGELPIREPKASTSKRYALDGAKDTSIDLTSGDESFAIRSRFSGPDGQWYEGSSPFFTHKRRIVERDEWIEVHDTFENRTGENLPIMQEHACDLKGRLKKSWLAGIWLPSGEGERMAPENPSIFASAGKAGLGLVALNDAFRVHVHTWVRDGTMALADRTFILEPGASYTADWAIVPASDADFWTFTNTARRMLDVNFTLSLAFTFVFYQEPIYQWSDAQLESFVRNKSANFVVQSNEASRYKGRYAYCRAFTAVPLAPYVDFQKRIRKLFPDGSIKTGIYYHCFIDNYDDADDAIFAKDRILDSAGGHMNYGGSASYDKLYVPTLTNRFGRETRKVVDTILDTIKADGIFWDEHQICRVAYTYDPDTWDGCSADINPSTHRIDRLKSSLALLSLPYRLKVAQRIMSGGPLITNGAPHTRTMLNLKYHAFVETGSVTNCGRMLLHSPIGLGDHLTENTFLDAYRGMLKMLDYGCLYAWYSHRVIPTHPTLVEHMFPFTPIELHEGYVIGQERILTNRSGLFGWGDRSTFTAHVYDRTGRETNEIAVPLIESNGKHYAELRIPEGYSAALVRKRP